MAELAEHARRGGGRRQRWFRHRRGDLAVRPFPTVLGTDAAARLRAVDELRVWAESQAEDAIDWYQRDKNLKRVISRGLRAVSVVLIVAGGTLPLSSAAGGYHVTGWGYVLLAVGAGCVAFDHFFGVSSGWMRDMRSIQRIRRRMIEFRLQWTEEVLGWAGRGEPDDQVDAREIARRLQCVHEFAVDVIDLIESETAEWLVEFQSSVGQLRSQAGASGIQD